MVRLQQQCLLTWDQFEQNVKQSFNILLQNQEFCDVTLACEDGHQIEAHKVVLTAGSSFFRNILLQAKHPHPFIYLNGIKKDQLDKIMNFVYVGETTVAGEELDSFLQVAKDLRIKGLESNEESEILIKEQESDGEKRFDDIEEDVDSHIIQQGAEDRMMAPNNVSAEENEKYKKEISIELPEETHEEATLVKTQGDNCGDTIVHESDFLNHKENQKLAMTSKKRKKVKVNEFQPSLLEMSIRGERVSTWLMADPENSQQLTCTLCPNNITFSVEHGWKDVKQHHKTVSHQENKIFAKFRIQQTDV